MFVDCIVDDNLHSLVISGKPTDDELAEAWGNILSEYTDAIGNNEYKLYVGLYKEISILKLTYHQILNAVSVLKHTYSEYLCNELNRLLGQRCVFNWNDQPSYQEALNKCLRRSKSIKISIDLKVIQFEGIQKKHKDENRQEYTRAYFDTVLINLSDHAKYEIQDTITVGKYCERVTRLNKYIENLRSERRNNR